MAQIDLVVHKPNYTFTQHGKQYQMQEIQNGLESAQNSSICFCADKYAQMYWSAQIHLNVRKPNYTFMQHGTQYKIKAMQNGLQSHKFA